MERDSKQLAEWLQALELAQVTLTATIDPSGRLGAVGGLWPKLLAATKEAALVGVLHVVVVAAEQSDISPELLAANASPLRILKAATLSEAVQKLYEEHGPRDTVRRYEREHCAHIDLLGRLVPLERHYQVLPLLRAVKRERLPYRSRLSPAADKEDLQFCPIDILRWEEELREERITYEGVSLKQVFNEFQSAAEETKAAVPRFVVLGPPGSGKTALIQYLGGQAANGSLRVSGRSLLPARIRLREWEVWTAQEGKRAHRLPQYLTERYKDLPLAPSAQQWWYWLRRGEVLLLLDGLDEIEGTPAFLTALNTAMTAFAQCPLVITCRTVSFEQHRALCPDFPIFTLAGLERDRRDAFIRSFPIEHPDHYDPDKLIAQLNRTPQMLPLAANPLLLAIICYVVDDAKGLVLPATRGELYARTLEKLLLYRPRVEIRYPGEVPHVDEKLTILQRTAFHLFVQRDRKLTFTGQELGQALQQALKEEGYGEAPAPWANALRVDLTQNSGILRESGEQGSFFLHLTVQEFLVAKAIAGIVHRQGWETPTIMAGARVSVRQLIDKKAWDPRWQEAITLFAGQLADPTPLVVLLAEEKKDDVFAHRLALAVSCLPEVHWTANGMPAALVNRLTAAVFSRWLRHEIQATTAAIPHLTRALSALGQVNGCIENVPLLQWLCLRLRDVNPDVRAGMAEALGHIGESIAHHHEVLSALVAALQDSDEFVRVKATEAFRRIGVGAARYPTVLSTLAQTAQRDENWFVRFGATRALEHMGTAVTTLPEVSSVLRKVKGDENQRRNSSVVATGGQQVDTDPVHLEALPMLLAALHDQDEGVRAKAVEAIKRSGKAGLRHPQVLLLLIEILLHDRDGGVRARAADVLAQMDTLLSQHPEVLLALVVALQDKDGGVCAQAARALGQLGKAAALHPAVLPALMEALRNDDSSVRAEAAETLGRMMAQGVRIFRRWWGRVRGKTVEELAALPE